VLAGYRSAPGRTPGSGGAALRRGARPRAQKLAGMTGTASTESQEFSTIYKLAVSLVPTNLPTQRADNPDVVFGKEAGAAPAPAPGAAPPAAPRAPSSRCAACSRRGSELALPGPGPRQCVSTRRQRGARVRMHEAHPAARQPGQ
jgi:hypothetical protein